MSPGCSAVWIYPASALPASTDPVSGGEPSAGSSHQRSRVWIASRTARRAGAAAGSPHAIWRKRLTATSAAVIAHPYGERRRGRRRDGRDASPRRATRPLPRAADARYEPTASPGAAGEDPPRTGRRRRAATLAGVRGPLRVGGGWRRGGATGRPADGPVGQGDVAHSTCGRQHSGRGTRPSQPSTRSTSWWGSPVVRST